MRRFIFVLAIVFLTGCEGGPCGGGQFGEARAFLPDSGINAGDTIMVSFHQRDMNEQTDVFIDHPWPSGIGSRDPEPDPRVRLLTDAGLVLVDAIGTRESSAAPRPSWFVSTTFRDARRRRALFDGFQTEGLWLELWRVGAPARGTRVRLQTDTVGTRPTLWCL